ncbi:MAG: hypothetical protein FWC26_12680 [Fibromonadales bacterium]|nr:hypothetical protein [Fibromonadales bacterium]
MKRKAFFAILAVSAFMFVAGLFGCSSDDDKFEYLSCEEFNNVPEVCVDKHGNDAQNYNSCVMKKICGNSKGSESCFYHYKDKCGWNGL